MLISLGFIANTFVFAEETENQLLSRDPLIPLVNEQGEFRRDFKKPYDEKLSHEVRLMGISKIGDKFFAFLDGEMVKEGQVYKDFKVEKIYADRIVLLYGSKTFELKWLTEEKK
jgi:hypothetical protein